MFTSQERARRAGWATMNEKGCSCGKIDIKNTAVVVRGEEKSSCFSVATAVSSFNPGFCYVHHGYIPPDCGQ